MLHFDQGLLLTTAMGGVPRQGPVPLYRLYRAGRDDWLLAMDADDALLVPIRPPPPDPVGPLIDRSPPPRSTEDAPSPLHPLGVKGAGEAGINAVGAAIASAIDDALGGDVFVTRLPVTPMQLMRELACKPGTSSS